MDYLKSTDEEESVGWSSPTGSFNGKSRISSFIMSHTGSLDFSNTQPINMSNLGLEKVFDDKNLIFSAAQISPLTKGVQSE